MLVFSISKPVKKIFFCMSLKTAKKSHIQETSIAENQLIARKNYWIKAIYLKSNNKAIEIKTKNHKKLIIFNIKKVLFKKILITKEMVVFVKFMKMHKMKMKYFTS